MNDRMNTQLFDKGELVLAEVPDDLAIAMSAFAEGVGDPAVSMAIDILNQIVSAGKNDLNANAPTDAFKRIALVDYFVMSLIVEEDGYFETWENHADEISGLLTAAEQFLLHTAYLDLDAPCYKTASPGVTPVCLVQRLNAYLAIAAGFSRDAAEFSRRLMRAVNDTIQNVSFLLSRWDRSELLAMEQAGGLDECMPDEKYWTEPLSLITYAAQASKTCIETRRALEGQYIPFLEKAGKDIEGARGRLLTDAELSLSGLLSGGLEEMCPEYPLDLTAGEVVKKLIRENETLPVVVFAGPQGTRGAYCNIDRVEVVELLNTHYDHIASVETSRKRFLSRVTERIREREGGSLSDEEVAESAREEALRFDGSWTPAIAIFASWKKL